MHIFFFFGIAPGHLSLWSVIYNEACDYRGGLGGGGGEKNKNKNPTQQQERAGESGGRCHRVDAPKRSRAASGWWLAASDFFSPPSHA